jgi:hypothetical protein
MLVCIPSKGRPGTLLPSKLEGLPYLVFVEPQDQASYQAAGISNLHVLSANDQGISFVRNYILDFARKHNHDWIWMMDDDVSNFGIAGSGKVATESADVVLCGFHEVASRYQFPVNGINYRQYAWACSKASARYRVNAKTAEVCTLLFIPKITWKYRAQFNLKEDRDFCLQAVKHSSGIFFDSYSCYNCPNVGTNTGGLQSEYLLKRDHEAALRFAREWHPYVSVVKKAGRVDAKLDVKGLALSLNRQVR